MLAQCWLDVGSKLLIQIEAQCWSNVGLCWLGVGSMLVQIQWPNVGPMLDFVGSMLA